MIYTDETGKEFRWREADVVTPSTKDMKDLETWVRGLFEGRRHGEARREASALRSRAYARSVGL